MLGISARIENKDGDTDALGTIADLYTELGDLENAGRCRDFNPQLLPCPQHSNSPSQINSYP